MPPPADFHNFAMLQPSPPNETIEPNHKRILSHLVRFAHGFPFSIFIHLLYHNQVSYVKTIICNIATKDLDYLKWKIYRT